MLNNCIAKQQEQKEWSKRIVAKLIAVNEHMQSMTSQQTQWHREPSHQFNAVDNIVTQANKKYGENWKSTRTSPKMPERWL